MNYKDIHFGLDENEKTITKGIWSIQIKTNGDSFTFTKVSFNILKNGKIYKKYDDENAAINTFLALTKRECTWSGKKNLFDIAIKLGECVNDVSNELHQLELQGKVQAAITDGDILYERI